MVEKFGEQAEINGKSIIDCHNKFQAKTEHLEIEVNIITDLWHLSCGIVKGTQEYKYLGSIISPKESSKSMNKIE